MKTTIIQSSPAIEDIANAIRSQVKTQGYSLRREIVAGVAAAIGEMTDRVEFVVDCMIEDGGLAKNARGWYFIPELNDEEV